MIIKFKAQTIDRVHVIFEDVVVRGVPYNGYGWFNVHYTKDDRLERAEVSGVSLHQSGMSAQDSRKKIGLQPAASKAAMRTLQQLLGDAALVWAQKNEEHLVEAERRALQEQFEQKRQAYMDSVALSNRLEEEMNEAKRARNDFTRTYPHVMSAKMARSVR